MAEVATIQGRLGRCAAVFASIIFISLAMPRSAQAAPVFFGWGGETVIKVMDFPDTRTFKDGGQHFDLGYRFKQITLFFIPVWNYDGQWCGYIPGDSSKYFDFDRAKLENLAETSVPSITLPAEPTIDWWDSYGGKIVVGLGLAAYVVYLAAGTKKAKTPAPTQS
ncbi:MAG: hypothetical protein ACHQAY_03000 [Hyphomicrobiales bacterium]